MTDLVWDDTQKRHWSKSMLKGLLNPTFKHPEPIYVLYMVTLGALKVLGWPWGAWFQEKIDLYHGLSLGRYPKKGTTPKVCSKGFLIKLLSILNPSVSFAWLLWVL